MGTQSDCRNHVNLLRQLADRGDFSLFFIVSGLSKTFQLVLDDPIDVEED